MHLSPTAFYRDGYGVLHREVSQFVSLFDHFYVGIAEIEKFVEQNYEKGNHTE